MITSKQIRDALRGGWGLPDDYDDQAIFEVTPEVVQVYRVDCGTHGAFTVRVRGDKVVQINRDRSAFPKPAGPIVTERRY